MDKTEQLQKFFHDQFKNIRLQTRLWRCRDLSLFGKVTIIKSFLRLKMIYVLSVLSTPQDFIKPTQHSSPWKAYINHLLQNNGGTLLFRCNCEVKDYIIHSTFYSECLQWWADFRNVFSIKPPISESVIWNNKLIT